MTSNESSLDAVQPIAAQRHAAGRGQYSHWVVKARIENPPFARAAMAAGALFVNDDEQVMLVQPTYKSYWDLPGGYVESGESPLQACRREVAEELGIRPTLGRLLALDWAPYATDGDKMHFIFDGGRLDDAQHESIKLQASEIAAYRYVSRDELPELTIQRLVDRVIASLDARQLGQTTYLEYGAPNLSK
ncbi:MAG: NUDIX domain-containing protein [Micromonosporaceae bacterium]